LIIYHINITPAALDDIQDGLVYYNSKAANLGFRFADEVDNSLQAIAKMPAVYGYRYKNVRAKLLYKFPFLIFFTVDEDNLSVDVLRIFHTSQYPYWLNKDAE
jgi:toxin ParE1/3/4